MWLLVFFFGQTNGFISPLLLSSLSIFIQNLYIQRHKLFKMSNGIHSIRKICINALHFMRLVRVFLINCLCFFDPAVAALSKQAIGEWERSNWDLTFDKYTTITILQAICNILDPASTAANTKKKSQKIERRQKKRTHIASVDDVRPTKSNTRSMCAVALIVVTVKCTPWKSNVKL